MSRVIIKPIGVFIRCKAPRSIAARLLIMSLFIELFFHGLGVQYNYAAIKSTGREHPIVG